MEKLQILKLCHNNLTNLSKNSFRGGPSWNLKELYLNGNPLKELNIFDELPNLEKLVLDEVTGLDFQETFSGHSLKHLKYLSLQNCNLTSLPDDIFQGMINLEYLSLSGNPLKAVPQAVQDIPTLRTLNLSHTGIEEIQTDAFVYSHNLKELYMEENKNLRVIHECAFCGLTSLQKLVLRGCSRLTQIHDSAFCTDESNLRTLDVEHARLSSLPSSLNLEVAETLKLGGNPWNCTCWLAKINEHQIDLSNGSMPPRCHWPLSLRGERVDFIRTSDVCPETHGIVQKIRVVLLLLSIVSVFLLIIYWIRRHIVNIVMFSDGYTKLQKNPEFV
ncbi:unnamed protein product [Gongylonema pulchrum]|uniref:LRRCT domain-containing protein n=1 Tax=Gongylonema pulchrum TaxID=637853 RepID=A0A183E5P7_9BILA|nr:unnamed protein product [Gongylonema pulchrum]